MSSNTRSYLSRASLGNKAAASGACGRRTGRRRLLRSRARQARGARPAAAAPFTRAHPACGARTAAALHRRVWPARPACGPRPVAALRLAGGVAPAPAWRPVTGGATASDGARARVVLHASSTRFRGLQGPAVRRPAPLVFGTGGAEIYGIER